MPIRPVEDVPRQHAGEQHTGSRDGGQLSLPPVKRPAVHRKYYIHSDIHHMGKRSTLLA